MRIVVHGQQAFGKSVQEALLERGEDVVGVYCAPEPAQGGGQRRSGNDDLRLVHVDHAPSVSAA